MKSLKNDVKAWLLLCSGLGTILFLMGSTFYIVVSQSLGLYSMGGEESQFSLEYWQAVLNSPVFQNSYIYSVKVSLLGAILSIIVAYPIAMWLRKKLPAKVTIITILRAPMLVPGLVAAFLFVNMISYHGILNEVFVYLGIWDEPKTLQNDEFGWGVVILQMWKNIPFALILIGGAVNSLKTDLLDAAANLGSNPWQRFRYVIFPLTLGAVQVSFILIFIGALGDFAFYSIAGPRSTYSLARLMQMSAYEFEEWNQSAVMALTIMLTSAFFTILVSLLIKPLAVKRGEVKMNSSLIFFILANFIWLFLPFLMAGLWSLVDPAKPWSYPDIFPQSLSFERWKIVWETTSLPEAMFNSYTIAPTVSLITILLSLPTAYAFGRMEFRGKKLAELLTLIPLVIPGMIIALFFSRMLLDLNINNPFIGIVIGHVVLTLPYAIRILSAGFSSVPQDLIDASRDLGASKFTVFKDVYMPMLKPSFLASIIFCLVKSIEEFAIAFVIGSPDFITVPTILYSFLGYSFIRPNAAVVSIILLVPNIILMMIIEKLLKGNYLSQSTGKA